MIIAINERSALFQPIMFYETVTVTRKIVDDYRFEDVEGDGFHQVLTAFNDRSFGFEVHQFIVALLAVEQINDHLAFASLIQHELIDKRGATWHMN